MRRGSWFAFLEPSPLEVLRRRLRNELPRGQARVALALICLPEDLCYGEVAMGLGIGIGTVHTHVRRIRNAHPDLHMAIMAERRRQLDAASSDPSATGPTSASWHST